MTRGPFLDGPGSGADARVTRRGLITGAAGLLLRPASALAEPAERRVHFPFGLISPPRSLPSVPVLTARGQATDLLALLRGHTTALQLMFTGCSATCPIQGALFAQAQALMAERPASVQWLSLSIDPLSDTPDRLASWLRRFGAGPSWLAASPRITDRDRLVERLSGDGEPPAASNDRHAGQVFLIDRRGALVFRTPSMPAAEQIVALLRRVDAAP